MKHKNAGKIAGNNEPQNPSETTQVDIKSNKKRRGRQEGYERPTVIVQIDDLYRINLSDGKNKTVQKLITSDDSINEELDDSEDNEENSGWKFKGHYGTFKGAFGKLYDLMVEDGVKKKTKNNDGIVMVKELIDIHREKLAWLKEVFTNDFKDDEVVSKPKYVKKIEEKKEK